MTALDKRLVIRIGEELEAWLAATSQRIGCDRATFARMALTELMNSGVEPRAPFQMAPGSAPHLAPYEARDLTPYELGQISGHSNGPHYQTRAASWPGGKVVTRDLTEDDLAAFDPSRDPTLAAIIAERLAEAPVPRSVPRTETGELLNGGPPAMSLRHVERNKFNPGR